MATYMLTSLQLASTRGSGGDAMQQYIEIHMLVLQDKVKRISEGWVGGGLDGWRFFEQRPTCRFM